MISTTYQSRWLAKAYRTVLLEQRSLTHTFHTAGAKSAAEPAAKLRYSFDIADDDDDATDGHSLLDHPPDMAAHGCKTATHTHQQNSNPQQLRHTAAASPFEFDIDDDGEDFDLDGSTAQLKARIGSNQHASTSALSAAAAGSVAAAVAPALPGAKPSSAGCIKPPSAPKLQALPRVQSAAQSAAPSWPGFQSASAASVKKVQPAVSKAQQPQPKKPPNTFKPPRRIAPGVAASAAAASATAAEDAAGKEAAMGTNIGGMSALQPLKRLRKAGTVVPQAVPKAQGNKTNDGEHGICNVEV